MHFLSPLTKSEGGIEELGIPLDNFLIVDLTDSSKIDSLAWHKLLANKDQFNTF